MYHANATVDALMKRGYLYLEDHEWKSAKGYFDDALDVDPESAQAYIGMLLAEMHIERECDLYTAAQSFAENYYYKKALRFADDDYQVKLQQYHLDNIYYQANMLFEAAKSEDEVENERKLTQLQHKKQQIENRITYYEKGDRRKRAHHLITRGAAIESVAPLTKALTETEFYAFAEKALYPLCFA